VLLIQTRRTSCNLVVNIMLIYVAETVDADEMKQFLDFADPLSRSALTASDGNTTVEECVVAIDKMENNKAPETDGLPKEFYSFFDLFATLLGICRACWQ